jgi:hypothetical protein
VQNLHVTSRLLLVAFGVVLGAVTPTTGAVSAAPAASTALRVNLSGASRAPVAGRRWQFVLRATDGAGRPVRAVASVHAALAGKPVDTVGRFAFSGSLRRSYRWSPTLVGAHATLTAAVTSQGAETNVSFAVRVVSFTGRPHFVVRLVPQNRAPRAGRRWRFAVYARDARDRPVGGTVVVRVAVAGHIVDTVGWFKFDGNLRRAYSWSKVLRGSLALFQARVIGPGGSRTVGYPVRVS